MKHIIILLSLLVSLLFTSCAAMKSGQGIETTYLSVEIFQTLNKNAALAHTRDWKVVKIESLEDTYYDGKAISGTFVLVDTYTYETKNETTKTVPVYIRLDEYRRLQKAED